MIVIADSGATKTSWRILSNDGSIQQAQTKGYNPYHHSKDVLSRMLTVELGDKIQREAVERVFFYGAGCSAIENIGNVEDALQEHFPTATIEVSHDLLAAARALCGPAEGIACILGTGANSCYFDGEKIVQSPPSLGYILGDEGSGANLGKLLVVSYLRNELPDEIMERMNKRFNLSRDEVLAQVYQGEEPARYLSSFSKFIFQNIKNPALYRMVYDALGLFFEKKVVVYPNYSEVPVHFTGSIAFYYGNILRQVAADLGVNVRNIVEDPIAGLTLYHQKFIK